MVWLNVTIVHPASWVGLTQRLTQTSAMAPMLVTKLIRGECLRNRDPPCLLQLHLQHESLAGGRHTDLCYVE